jgi:ligand-binding sensor domain-containing protein
VPKRTLLALAVLALLAAACGGDDAAPSTTVAGTTATTGATTTTLVTSTTIHIDTTTSTATTLPPEPEVGWMAWAATNLGDNTVVPPPCAGCTGGDNPVERWRPIVFVDAAGLVWVDEPAGLTQWDPISGDYGAVRGLLDPAVFGAARAADGTLWLATYGGANTFDGTRFAVGLTTEQGLKGETTWSVWAQSNGTVWVTTNQGYILSAWDGATLRHYSDADTAAQWGPGIEAVFPAWTQFNSATEGPDGTMWFGTSGNGLFSFDGTEWRRYTEDDGLLSSSVEAVAFTPDGTMWLDVIGGVVRFDGAAFEVIDPEVMGDWQGEYPDEVAVGPDGALWVLANRAVFRLLDGTWEAWTEVDGMELGDTASLAIGEDGSVWVSDMYGLARYGEMLPASNG